MGNGNNILLDLLKGTRIKLVLLIGSAHLEQKSFDF